MAKENCQGFLSVWEELNNKNKAFIRATRREMRTKTQLALLSASGLHADSSSKGPIRTSYPLTSSTTMKSLPSPLLKRMRPSEDVVLNWKNRCME